MGEFAGKVPTAGQGGGDVSRRLSPGRSSRRRAPTSRAQIAFIRGARTAERTILVPGGLEDGVERGSEVRSAIADQGPNVLEPLAEGEGEVAGLLHCPVAGGVRGPGAAPRP